MQAAQVCWNEGGGWTEPLPSHLADAQLGLVFGSRTVLQRADLLEEIRAAFPDAILAGCSTSGEVVGQRIEDDTLTLTLLRFERTDVRLASTTLAEHGESSFETGKAVAETLKAPDLRHVLVFSDGLKVNGTALAEGLSFELPEEVTTSGGLAGDGSDFAETLVLAGDRLEPARVAAIGFYGEAVDVSPGCAGGWDPFGTVRQVTKIEGNRLYELDGRPALEIYEKYLGDEAAGLPSSGLKFPLSITQEDGCPPLVRTLLAHHPEDGSLTFAGDFPVGSSVQLMTYRHDRLIDGAEVAVQNARAGRRADSTEVAVVVSCIGRRLVMGQRAEEELEICGENLDETSILTGFYSYGELAPAESGGSCRLHNQTMAVTLISERV